VRFAPFFLDPSTPPEGKPRRQYSQPGDPPSPLEQRGASLGITFTRGRTWTSNSHLALQAGEFAEEHGDVGQAFHKRLFKAYFEELADIGKVDELVRLGGEAGLPADELRAALESGRYCQQVDDGLAWSHAAGVRAVPTFIFDERMGLVGAQPSEVFEELMQELGAKPR